MILENMNNKATKILLILLIIIHTGVPFIELAINGYPSLMAMLADIYDNGVIIILSAAVLNLYNSRNRMD